MFCRADGVAKRHFGGIGRVITFLQLVMLAVILGYFAWKIGHRPEWVGTDTYAYVSYYNRVVGCQCLAGTSEYAFGLVAIISSFLGLSASGFLTVMSGIQLCLLVCLALALERYLGYERSRGYVYVFLALMLVSPLFLSAQINIIRQGTSSICVALSGVAFLSRNYKTSVVWGVLALGFHLSAALYLVLFSLLGMMTPLIVVGAGALLVVYMFGFSEQVVMLLSRLTGGALYGFVHDYGGGAQYATGVRLDFALALIIPPVIVAVVGLVWPSEVAFSRFRSLLPLYLLLTVPFLLFGWGAFSDRYAFNAWAFAPALISIALLRFVPTRLTVPLVLLFLISAVVYGGLILDW